jgi:tRNA threonylcarbamoyladenosine biosynthesis protein TsaE
VAVCLVRPLQRLYNRRALTSAARSGAARGSDTEACLDDGICAFRIARMTPILDDRTVEFFSRSPDQTRRLGARLGHLLQGGEVVCLEGPLGAGKTVLAQGIGRGWGATTPLISPSFVLVRQHHHPASGHCLLHVDFYRLGGAEEAHGLGLEDWLEDPGIVAVVEWPERALGVLPEQRLWIHIDFANGGRRRLLLTAQGESYADLLQEFRRVAFGVT